MHNNMEELILSSCIYNEEYVQKVISNLKKEYFLESRHSTLYELIETFYSKYKKCPTKEILYLELKDLPLNEKLYNEIQLTLNGLEENNSNEINWLIESTEKFCQNKAIYNALCKSIEIADNKDKNKEIIPNLLIDALSVSFSKSIGHDFIDDYEKRYEFYHLKENKIPFDLDILNRVTKGGLSNKTLTLWLAQSGVGKSMIMCHCAASNLMIGKNVLYITLEMSEERIAQRIDSNLLDCTMDELLLLSKESYTSKMKKLKDTVKGKLIIKEYPTSYMNVNHLRSLINDLKIRLRFKPDIIYIDYLGLCSSTRVKGNIGTNTYVLLKAIAEEMRGLAMEYDLPVVSAAQITRQGYYSSDLDFTNVAGSVGLIDTSDYMFGIISTEELNEMGQIMIKRLKDRYNDPNIYKNFVLGIDRGKMRFYNVSQDAIDELEKTFSDKIDSSYEKEEDFTIKGSLKFKDMQ